MAEHENVLRRDIAELKRDLRETELRMEARLAETNVKIAETKADLTRWVIGAGVSQTTVMIGVLLKIAKLI
ncbi:hypothetical protein [Thiocystis violacea]|uniref:hypothetical protein n=1 Tax=Thiocystis violacea TaxID=13725 RepID=UPI0019062AEA|nr:hypothetical protein [Thiocystis violacea]